MRHHRVTEEPAPITVRDRLTAAGLSAERIEQHVTDGRVRVDGELATDLATPAPTGTRAVIDQAARDQTSLWSMSFSSYRYCPLRSRPLRSYPSQS